LEVSTAPCGIIGRPRKQAEPPYARVIEYLKKHGHQGFFREMLWHLLPKKLQRMLYAARKEVTLDQSVWPEDKPIKGKAGKKSGHSRKE
jgi:hypothetical protein